MVSVDTGEPRTRHGCALDGIDAVVFEQLDDTIPCGYEAYGPQRLKNIAQRVRVYRVRTEPEMVGWVVPGRLLVGMTVWPMRLVRR